MCVIVVNCVLIGHAVAETWRLMRFVFKMAALRHFGFVICIRVFRALTTNIWWYLSLSLPQAIIYNLPTCDLASNMPTVF